MRPDVRRWIKTSVYYFESYEYALVVKTTGHSVNNINAPETVLFTQIIPKSERKNVTCERLVHVKGCAGALCLVESNIVLKLEEVDDGLRVTDAETTRTITPPLSQRFEIDDKKKFDPEKKKSSHG